MIRKNKIKFLSVSFLFLIYILVFLTVYPIIEHKIFIFSLPLIAVTSILYGFKVGIGSFFLTFILNSLLLSFLGYDSSGIIVENIIGIIGSFLMAGLIGYTTDLNRNSRNQLKELQTQKDLLLKEVEAKLKSEKELGELRDDLENLVEKRASELKSANQKLALVLKEQFETEINLRRSEEYYRLLFESVHDAIIIYDPETEKILDVNKTACELYGYEKEELICYSIEVLNKGKKENKRINEHGEINKYETVHFKNDGSPVILFISAAAIYFKGDQVILSVNRDITHQKKEEEKIYLLANALESINDSVIISDVENKIIFVNKSFTNVYSYGNEKEVLGKSDSIIFPAGESFYLYKNLNPEIIKTGSVKCESENIKKNGEIFPVNFSLSAVKDNNNETIARIFVIEDISARKKIENELKIYKENLEELIERRTAQLKETNEKLNEEVIEKEKARQQILEMNIRLDMAITASGNGFIDIQLDRKKVYVSPVFLNLLGYDSLDFEMVVNNWRRFVHYDDVRSILYSLNKHIKTNTASAEFVHRILTRKGVWKWFSTKLKIVEKDIKNRPQRISIVLDDITMRKVAEEEIEKNLKKEKELNELKSRFVSTVSHEFRTPLTSIYASTELLLRYFTKWNDDKRNQTLERIKDSVEFMNNMITEILTINRADSGKLEFQPDKIDIINLCKNLLEEVQIIAKPEHHLIFKSEFDIYNGNFDEKLLRYIIQNLLTNSIKYSPDGGKIELAVNKEISDLKISVMDEGIGIAEEDKQKLYTPFFRGKNTATIPGTGLGLSILKRSVDLHKGRITFESTPGKGTIFYIYLPLN